MVDNKPQDDQTGADDKGTEGNSEGTITAPTPDYAQEGSDADQSDFGPSNPDQHSSGEEGSQQPSAAERGSGQSGSDSSDYDEQDEAAAETFPASDPGASWAGPQDPRDR
ncbi:hypothetical protein J2S40_001179 [Nocardioides luteus]|uniref:Uncharacterized protein n=1 Tax=Nocardioides luteus TaxID=1844 RepID=A0ABQ5ST50_9ACTN|nr:hypothetical protein [Nocardioides luteus]MDR7310121.1 hypothetical protein [Nocardioides luteus]GGR64657.1 hypothetical protein GCM10010197_35100 [Nocardioides luteus]GLJ66971.1 hypothetical protein GCM10017579_10070 [Nocardioides luteus]